MTQQPHHDRHHNHTPRRYTIYYTRPFGAHLSAPRPRPTPENPAQKTTKNARIGA